MRQKSSRRARVVQWLLRLMALPAFYVLSMGPVAGLLENGTIPRKHYGWLRDVYAPLVVLSYSNTSNTLSSAYVRWWIHVLEKPAEKVARQK
jgi:hypothetical protein